VKKLNQIIKYSKKPCVILLVGPPLSGKSTLCKTLENFTIISRDEIIVNLGNGLSYNDAYKTVSHKEVDKTYKAMILSSAKKKENVAIDMTSLTEKRRRCNIANFGKDYTKIAVVFPILSDIEFEKRNEKRQKEEDKFISKKVYDFMCESYKRVEKSEGFDHIIYV